MDGYLNDFCQFEIGITTTLPDFAVVPLQHFQDLNGSQRNGRVRLEWKLNDELKSLKTESFEVRRRFEREKKFTKISVLPAERTVHGEFKTKYQYIDTVGRKGYYYYEIIAVAADSNKYLVGNYATLSNPVVTNVYLIPVELPCKEKTPVTIFIYNWENDFLLTKIPTTYSGNGNFVINVKDFFQPDVLRLKLVAYDQDGKKLKEVLVDRKY